MSKLRALVAGFVLASGLASACGVCIEDKMAVVYDHDLVTGAIARHHVVVFADVKTSTDTKMTVEEVRRAAEGIHGIDRGSVRVATDPTALSFAMDLALKTPQAALAAIERQSTRRSVKLTLLKVVE